MYYCNQLFTPKCNKTFERVEDAKNACASLTLHFRDDPEGNIYLQCEYCDFIDRNIILDIPEEGIDDPLGDYDF